MQLLDAPFSCSEKDDFRTPKKEIDPSKHRRDFKKANIDLIGLKSSEASVNSELSRMMPSLKAKDR